MRRAAGFVSCRAEAVYEAAGVAGAVKASFGWLVRSQYQKSRWYFRENGRRTREEKTLARP